MRKTICVFLALFLSLTLLLSCNSAALAGEDMPINGEWIMEDESVLTVLGYGGVNVTDANYMLYLEVASTCVVSFNFRDDGTFRLYISTPGEEPTINEGTWSYAASGAVCWNVPTGSNRADYSIEGDRLTLHSGKDVALYLRRSQTGSQTDPVLPGGPTAPVTPIVPEIPTIPVTPVVPEIPTIPVTPVVPEIPTIPVTPVVPEIPVVPVTPIVPEIPTIPVTPVVPEIPTIPVTPVVPEIPTIPVTPVVPEIPATPVTPVVPEIPAVPEVPAAPDASSMLNLSKVQPAATEAPAADPLTGEWRMQAESVVRICMFADNAPESSYNKYAQVLSAVAISYDIREDGTLTQYISTGPVNDATWVRLEDGRIDVVDLNGVHAFYAVLADDLLFTKWPGLDQFIILERVTGQ
ncbi:MAG: hypothetical protein CW338_01020 [Clostridiales bacterium]|nr:hypothetical protein [Clostridiales bacterium]